MNICLKIIFVSLVFLNVLFKNCIAQEGIGESKSSIEAKLIKSTFKILESTNEKIMAEFPEPKMLYEYYFKSDICYKYEGLIPVSERDYYISEQQRNGWLKSSVEDNKVIFKRGPFVLKIITLTDGIGYFKFQVDKN